MDTVAPKIGNQIYIDGMPLITYQYGTIFMSILVVLILSLVAFLWTRRLKAVPGRGQALLELIVSAFRDLVYSTMGPRDGRHYLPLIGTIFLFVWTCNMIGLIPTADIFHSLTGDTSLYFTIGGHTVEIPGSQEPTRNVNFPWALGLMTFFIMHIAAIARKGPAKYFDEYFHPHLGSFNWPLQKPVLAPRRRRRPGRRLGSTGRSHRPADRRPQHNLPAGHRSIQSHLADGHRGGCRRGGLPLVHGPPVARAAPRRRAEHPDVPAQRDRQGGGDSLHELPIVRQHLRRGHHHRPVGRHDQAHRAADPVAGLHGHFCGNYPGLRLLDAGPDLYYG
ncbi:MAG: F0F1 ATP synthase subunit A [Anaerolineaceae bacterium]|nr:F0F1 ATP synthase subunit A [Anaerolineaceae bacterium]